MKRWYVVQVYAGYEEAVKTEVEKRIKEQSLQDSFGEILIPSAKVKQFFDTADTEDQNLFPGYVLVELEPTTEAVRLVTSSPRVLHFLGGRTPAPLGKKEVERIFSQMKGEVVVAA